MKHKAPDTLVKTPITEELLIEVRYKEKLYGYERLKDNKWEWMVLDLNPDIGERWTPGVLVSVSEYERSLISSQVSEVTDEQISILLNKYFQDRINIEDTAGHPVKYNQMNYDLDCKTANKFRSLLSQQTTGEKWISVEERLPEIGKKVLVDCAPLQIATAYYHGKLHPKEPTPACNGWSLQGVTHWQPLPSSPDKWIPGNHISIRSRKQ